VLYLAELYGTHGGQLGNVSTQVGGFGELLKKCERVGEEQHKSGCLGEEHTATSLPLSCFVMVAPRSKACAFDIVVWGSPKPGVNQTSCSG
jgi:hypothetical protein